MRILTGMRIKMITAVSIPLVLFALVGCSKDEAEDQPRTSAVTITVHDGSTGIPVTDLRISANTLIGGNSKVGPHSTPAGEATTDDNGQAVLALPESATVTVGLERDDALVWQTPFVVPINDTALVYSLYNENTVGCLVVEPEAEIPCPEAALPTPTPTPTPSETAPPATTGPTE